MLCYTVQQRIPTGMWECFCIHLENSNCMYHKGMSDRMELNIKKKKKRERKGRHNLFRNLKAYRKAPQELVLQRAHY